MATSVMFLSWDTTDQAPSRNHVKNDLDPYVCLVEECEQPDFLYSHSDEWMSHLHEHGKIWRCSSHRQLGPFSTRDEYISHVREAHNTKLSDTQLRVLANKNTRKIAKLFVSCPLCGEEEANVKGRLEDHITGHLRCLALKSLPSYEDEIPEDVRSGKDSVDVSQPQSRSTVKKLKYDKTEDARDDGKPELTETNPTNFFGEAYTELDPSHEDALMAIWVDIFDELASQKSFGSLEDDPVIQSIIESIEQRMKGGSTSPDDPKMSMADLASRYRNQGRWKEAEELEMQVIEAHKGELGADHPDTLSSMANLAFTFWKRGRGHEAETLEVQILEARMNKLGADHPDTLSSMANLAATFWNQGRWDEVEKLEEQVLEIFKSTLGADHPSTLASMASLAFTWDMQGRRDDSLALMETCAEARRQVLGPTHPDTISSASIVKWWRI